MSTELDSAIVAEAGELEALQRAVVRVLTQHPALAAAKIGHEDDGDIENMIEMAFAAGGLLLIVLSPAGSSESPDSASLRIDKLEVRVRIIEVPIINRGANGTRIPINRAVQMVACHLRHQIIAGAALTFVRFEPSPGAEVPTKDVVFTTSLTLHNL